MISMKYITSFLLMFFVFGILSTSAQRSNLSANLLAIELIKDSEALQQIDINKEQAIQKTNNGVFITQIGEGNMVNASLKARDFANASFEQNGDLNKVNSNITAQSIENKIIQNGTNNQVIDYINAPSQDVSLQLNQQGNDLYFERFGSNSIGDKIQFNMTGSFKTIIVRNFQ